jgi:hypothetical protein
LWLVGSDFAVVVISECRCYRFVLEGEASRSRCPKLSSRSSGQNGCVVHFLAVKQSDLYLLTWVGSTAAIPVISAPECLLLLVFTVEPAHATTIIVHQTATRFESTTGRQDILSISLMAVPRQEHLQV